MVGLAALFLATKVEETPRRLKDVIDRAFDMCHSPLDPVSQKYNVYRSEILTCEKSLLQTIAFDLSIDHPYKYILDFITAVCGNEPDKVLAQLAWNFINDRLWLLTAFFLLSCLPSFCFPLLLARFLPSF